MLSLLRTCFGGVLRAAWVGFAAFTTALPLAASANTTSGPAPDPSALRLVPLELVGLEMGATVNTGVTDVAVGRTRGFSLSAQPSGALRLQAEGEPFQSVLGGTAALFNYDAAAAAWLLQTPQGSVKVQVNARFADADAGSGQALLWSGVTLCRTGSPSCALFLLATSEQVCRLLASGNFQADPARRQQALQALNLINAQAVTCARP
ncbi:MAG: hypothetical protein WCT47_20820 [Betaproteobacteria bacterium]